MSYPRVVVLVVPYQPLPALCRRWDLGVFLAQSTFCPQIVTAVLHVFGHSSEGTGTSTPRQVVASLCPSPILSLLFLQVESSDTPKDTAAVPKCPPPCPEASPAEPLPNGDLEADGAQWKGTEEGGASPKSGRPEEDETESLADGETGRALENGRCTPKEGLDAPADEGELAPSDPQKKRGRRKLLEATEKSKI